MIRINGKPYKEIIEERKKKSSPVETAAIERIVERAVLPNKKTAKAVKGNAKIERGNVEHQSNNAASRRTNKSSRSKTASKG